jgi:hypothetical protein
MLQHTFNHIASEFWNILPHQTKQTASHRSYTPRTSFQLSACRPSAVIVTIRELLAEMTGPTATTLYHLILPTIFLNPVLFLHSLNTILTKLLPSLNGYEGNYAQPHIDIHASESLCWSYTALIVWAQMLAFLRFDRLREERETARIKKGARPQQRKEDNGYG